jgi:hypothetical protein
MVWLSTFDNSAPSRRASWRARLVADRQRAPHDAAQAIANANASSTVALVDPPHTPRQDHPIEGESCRESEAELTQKGGEPSP